MGLTSAIATTAGAASNAIGAWSQAQGQRTQLGLDATLADLNGQMKEQQARGAVMAGQRQSQGIMLQTARTKSSQRAAMAANGVALDSDSAVNQLSSTDYMGQVDSNAVEGDAARQAMGLRMDAVTYRNQALMDRATRKSISPTMSAVTSLIGSSSQVANSWSNPAAQKGWQSFQMSLGKLWSGGKKDALAEAAKTQMWT
ncbi:hypothetical protein [Asticcacaulis solisilvae]|uniref:hypothetical protein n=1 Tax=Asticcacaulis solisilvae TaxID=1217274 RepID=UPI003FD71CC1